MTQVDKVVILYINVKRYALMALAPTTDVGIRVCVALSTICLNTAFLHHTNLVLHLMIMQNVFDALHATSIKTVLKVDIL